MDRTTTRLVDFAMAARYADLPAQTVTECKRRLVDGVASALAAYDEPLSASARALARRYAGCGEAGIWGSTLRTTMEAAALTNGVMLRYLDISDTYLGKSRGHPSDMLSGIVAVAEHLRADGPSVINAVVLAYDIYCGFSDTIDFGAKGLDQPVYGIVGCVAAIGRLMGLTAQQMGHAISLALTPNVAMAQARRGDLSSWKGCAGANGSRNAVFAALLAKEGFTGPDDAIEGRDGLWKITGEFQLQLPTRGSHMLPRTHLKSLPICYHGQSSVLAALDLRGSLRLQDVATIDIEAYGAAVQMMGSDPSRWAPTTRETADHSMPYVVSIALTDGEVTPRSFSAERLRDPALRALMGKVRVKEDPALSAQYPEGAPTRLTVTTSGGETIRREVRYPLGHARNPMDDDQVARKFRGVLQDMAGAERCEAILHVLRNFEQVADVKSELIDLLAIRPSQDA